MHKIIGAAGAKNVNLGEKGATLAELDKAGAAPDFIILSSEIFSRALAADKRLSRYIAERSPSAADPGFIRKKILAWKLDARVLKEARQGLASLGIKKFLVLASFPAGEPGRAERADARHPRSCGDTSRLGFLVKTLWAAGFLDFLKARKAGPGPRLAVIIQRCAAPDYIGAAFADFSRDREVYIEYSGKGGGGRGPGKKKYVFLEKSGTSYFNDNEVEQEHSGWLLRLAGELLCFKSKFDSRFLRAEFLLSGDRLYIVGAEKAGGVPALEDQLFKFENECRYNYHYTDFSDREVNAILRALGVAALFSSELAGGEMFIKYSVLEALEKEIREKARRAGFAAKFHNAFLGFILAEAKRTKALDGETAPALFAGLKKINFRQAVFNYLYTRILKFSLESLRSELAPEVFDACNERFLASIETPLGGFLRELAEDPAALDLRYGPAVMGRIKQAADIRGLLKKADAKRKAAAKKMRGAGSGHREHFEALRRLVSLKNAVNSRFSVISALYAEKLAGADGAVDKQDIGGLCKLPGGEIARLLRGGKGPARSRGPELRGRGKKSGAQRRLHAAFPLKGLAAQAGDVSGVVKIAGDNLRFDQVGSDHILVADHLDSSFLVPMLLCKGIITAKGGATSPAAVIAKEIKKPCLINVFGCTEVLKDGDKIAIKNGRICKL